MKSVKGNKSKNTTPSKKTHQTIAGKHLKDFGFIEAMIDSDPLDAIALAHGLLKIAISGKMPIVIEEVMTKLHNRLEPVAQGERKGLDAETEVLPVCEWAAFIAGMNL